LPKAKAGASPVVAKVGGSAEDIRIDVKRAKDKHDPFFQHDKEWAKAFEQLLRLGVRAEQQALAKHELNCVMDNYLPVTLKHPEKFLP
jgi:DNA topoisomerase-6 subunit A